MTEKRSKYPDSTTIGIDALWDIYSETYPSIVDYLFTVIERKTVHCKKCKHDSYSWNYHLSFPLQVKGQKSVKSSFNHALRKEEVQDYKCEKCNRKDCCEIYKEILKIPEVFILQLQRFAHIPKLKKIRDKIIYSEELDMSQIIRNDSILEPINQPPVY